jgi:hypothetical protein
MNRKNIFTRVMCQAEKISEGGDVRQLFAVVDGKECQAAYFSLQQAKTRSSSFFLV